MNALILSLLAMLSPHQSELQENTRCDDIEWIDVKHSKENYRFVSEQTCHLGAVHGISVHKIKFALISDKKNSAADVFQRDMNDEHYLFSTNDVVDDNKSTSDIYADTLSPWIGRFWIESKAVNPSGNLKRVRRMQNLIRYEVDENDFVKVTVKNSLAIERIPYVPSSIVKRIVRMQVEKSLAKFQPVAHLLIRRAGRY